MAAALKFSRVRRFAWPVFAVSRGGETVGFVAQLPDGCWMAYRQAGTLADRFASRELAAEALAGAPSSQPEGIPRQGPVVL
ncbi:MAG TPA: hypothetical protein VKV26_10030 [Dehalococcoidia bacterium]|nr:hypothetical protein [Dehalococcoidia bacterium]